MRRRDPLFAEHWLLTSAFVLVTLHSSLVTVSSAQGIITTVAGNGRVIGGVGGPAANAALGELQGVAVDAAGNVFATDGTNNQVVKISPAGFLTIAAGNDLRGFSGDGGPATSASLNFPRGAAVDAAGNLYIAELNNHRIRKVSPDGFITTVAGDGRFRFAGDGGPATNASLASPRSVAIDGAGNLYIADSNNYRVRKVSPDGIITTVAGNGVAGIAGDGGPALSAFLNFPQGVAVDAAGNIFIADINNHRIRKVGLDGIISTVAGTGVSGFTGDNGPATSASLFSPEGVAVDAAGNVFIADRGNGRIRKVSSDGMITTVAGRGFGFSGDGGAATLALFNGPIGVAVSGGFLFIADRGNGRIRRVSPNGTINTLAGTGLGNFSGDGGPAASALLSLPHGVAADAAGSLYIADRLNHRIRKVSPAGIITTVAGNGLAGFSGDGGNAGSASLFESQDVAVDAAGNLYIADTGNNRIRKVSFIGVISTVAGNGSAAFSGDDGAATSASFRSPTGVAVDTAGNLYIADLGNHRIRKVSSAGIITTVAGNGVAGFSGDGSAATSASLNAPQDVAVDGAGNLYIADGSNGRVRKVTSGGTISTLAGGGSTSTGEGVAATSVSLNSPSRVALDSAGNLYIGATGNARVRKVSLDETITTVAGSGVPGFAGDGGPATRASLDSPRGVAVDVSGNIYIADALNDRIRKVLAAPPAFTVAPTALNFTVVVGSGVSAPQQITISSSVVGLGWSAATATESNGDWLAVSPVSGTTTSAIGVFVNAAAGLAPGTYRGTVTVSAPLASPPSISVAVTLTVDPAPAARLAVEPAALTFEGNAGAGNPPAQALRITNAGDATLNWTAQATTTTGGNWLSLSPASGSASAASPATVQVSASVGTLSTGTFSGSIRLQSSTTNQTVTVPVTFVVSQATRILLSQRGLLFTGVAGEGAPPAQNFGVLNAGSGSMSWTAEAATFAGGNWLIVTPAAGSSTVGSAQPPLVDLSVRVAGLAAGQYNGVIRIGATGANNSPQFVTVTLNMLPAGSRPPVVVRPTGLIFVRQAGTSSPGSQTVRLGTPLLTSVQAAVNPFTLTGGGWLDVLPRNVSVSATDARVLTVQPTLGELAPGEYFGALTLLFSDLTSQNVNVLFVVTPGATALTARAPGAKAFDAGAGPAADPNCVPQRLYATVTSLSGSFSAPVGYPASILAQVRDDCDNPVADAQVTARFDNGDAPVVLNSVGDGIYQESWQPSSSGQANRTGAVRITVRATRAPLPAAEASVGGQVISNAVLVPSVNSGGVVNAASSAPGEPLAPGSILSLYGTNLATAAAGAATAPLPTTLANATLSIGGRDVPLFYSSAGQINAQLPFDLPANSRQHVFVRVRRDDGAVTASVPETVTIAAARPAIFTTNQQGSGQGAILNQNFTPNSGANPATRGSVVQVFSTGLGATNPAVPAGQQAPASPLSHTASAVQAQIGGQTAAVQFAGLAPGFVGLYQVNVFVPAGAPTGDAVPLVLTQDGVPSNTVTLAIR